MTDADDCGHSVDRHENDAKVVMITVNVDCGTQTCARIEPMDGSAQTIKTTGPVSNTFVDSKWCLVYLSDYRGRIVCCLSDETRLLS